jgi:hypothetical protein
MKVIRALAAGTLASSALFAGGLSVVATVTSSAGPAAAAVAGGSSSATACPGTTHYEYGVCAP